MSDSWGKLHPERWRAQWIWGPGEAAPENTYLYFRKSFQKSSRVSQALCHISADTSYCLWVNGNLIGRGPLHGDPRWQSFDTYDVGDLITPGENVIGVIAYHYGTKEKKEILTLALHPSQGGFFFQLEMEDDSGEEMVVSDPSWAVSQPECWKPSPKYDDLSFAEIYDARGEPSPWLEKGYDDHLWGRPKPVRVKESTATTGMVFPWVQMEARDIPFLRETIIRPSSIHQLGESLELYTSSIYFVAARMAQEVIEPSIYTGVQDPENLISGDGITTLIPFDPNTSYEDFDGFYNPLIVLDMGELVNAHLEFEVEGNAGATIDIGYADVLIGGRVSPFYPQRFGDEEGAHAQADQYVLDGGRAKWQTFNWRHFRYLQLTFRNLTEPLKIHDLKFIKIDYPTEDRGSFECDDSLLNWAWQAGAKTSKLCMTDRFMDAPNRERRQHITDVTTVLPVNFAAFGDLDIHHRYMRVAAQSQTEYGLILNANPGQGSEAMLLLDASFPFIERIWQNYEYYGNLDLLKELFPRLYAFIELLRRYSTDDGLLGEPPFMVFFDQADIDRDGVNLALNAFYVRDLDLVARMAQVVGREDVAESYRDEHEGLVPTLASKFWDDDRGVFVEKIKDGFKSDHVSEHGNFLMIAFGYANDEQISRALNYLDEKESTLEVGQVESLFFIWAGEALFGIGNTKRCLDMIRKRYGRMQRRGLATTGEMWSLHGIRSERRWLSRSRRSASHSGATSPTYLLSRYVLGVTPKKPGFSRVEIAPQVGDLKWAKGVWPAPQGDIVVDWRFEDSGFVLECVLPPEIEGEVVLPPEVGRLNEHVSINRDGEADEAGVGDRIPVKGKCRLKVNTRE